MIELSALCEIVKPLEYIGATLVAITPQLGEFSKRLIEKRNLNYDMLSDVNNSHANRLGL
jgi:peroxiredoxin